jgi:hypothetical protein
MSVYGSPRPPWDGQPPEPSGPPPPYSAPPASGPPFGAPQSGPPLYGQPPQPFGEPQYAAVPGAPNAPGPNARGPVAPRRGGPSITVILATIVMIALCGGGAFTAFKLTNGNDTPGAGANPSTSTQAEGRTPADGTAPVEGAAPPTSTPEAPTNPDDLKVGDCFVNEGSQSDPEVRRVQCSKAGSFKVVAKVAFTTDGKRCADRQLGAGPGRYDTAFVMDRSPGNQGDYVLCLREN